MKTNVEYLAGLFDGEGCITIRKQRDISAKRGYTYALLVDVSQKRSAVLFEYKTRWGGSIGKGKRCDRWQVYSSKAKYALKDLAPYLIVKREEAIIAIEFQDYKDSFSNMGSTGISDFTFEKYHTAYRKLQELKREHCVQAVH